MAKYILKLPPSPGNPRNSEGSFASLKDGRLLFAYSRFTGGDSDDAAAAIVARISHDGGRIWDRRDRVLIDGSEAQQNVMSVSLGRLADGRLAMVYLVKHGFHDCRPYLRVSKDEGETWSNPRCLIPSPGYHVVNNDRLVVLGDGSLILPVARHPPLRLPDGRHTLDAASAFLLVGSPDATSWQTRELGHPKVDGVGMQEPGFAELPDGTFWLWARGDLGFQWQTFSRDRGATWSAPEKSPFVSPCSPLSAKRLPDGRLLAVWNQPMGKALPSSWGRTPLLCATSKDGRTWDTPMTLEDDPATGFCYVALHPYRDDVLLAYCAGGADGSSPLSGLRMQRLRLVPE